jgi:hypothetical protein
MLTAFLMILLVPVSSLVTERLSVRVKASPPFGDTLKSLPPISLILPLQRHHHKQQPSSTALSMVRTRGLEQNRQTATPTGMFSSNDCHGPII